MSFHFNWPRFSDQFHADATQMLNAALNKGNKPRIIADKIEVVELSMGTQPPELEIRDIGEITTDQFRGIFRLSYAGDAHIVLSTKVQANPLNHKKADMDVMGSSRGILAAHQPLIVPMLLRLSNFRLNAYVVLVVSKQKGITLVFKTDPLQNVDVNSTFDSITVIQKFIQKEIEGQLREMFREDLPAIIHRLSQRWTAGRTKVEAPYLNKNPTTLAREKVYTPSADAISRPPSVHPHSVSGPASIASSPGPHIALPSPGGRGYAFPAVGLRPAFVPRPLSIPRLRVPAPRSALSRVSEPLPSPKSQSPHTIERVSSFPDLENYDPTYGLRPEGLPSKSGYSGLGKLFSPAKGFADLGEVAEESSVRGGEEGTEYDVVEWEDTVPDYSTHPPSVAGESEVEYETLPAVGGGTIMRPRVVHSQTMGVSSDTISRTSRPASTVARSALHTPSTSRPQSHTPRNGSQIHLQQSILMRLDDESSPPDPVTTWRDQQLRQQQYNPYFPEMGVSGPSKLGPGRAAEHHHPHQYHLRHDGQVHSRRQSATSDVRLSSSSSYTRLSHSSSGRPPTVSTPPSSDHPPGADDVDSPNKNNGAAKERSRRRSLSPSIIHPSLENSIHFGSPPRHHHHQDHPQIILRPQTVSHLSALSASYHTLSPYTHSVEHFTVRSGPPKTPVGVVGNGISGLDGGVKVGGRAPVRAKRKRMIRLGAKKSTSPEQSGLGLGQEERKVSGSGSYVAPSEFSEEVDHYFKPGSGEGMRLRVPYEQAVG